eukprot:6112828-Prymnesium_polylepis.1
MPVAQQIVTIATSSIFVTGHGAALGWLPFLNAQEGAIAIEIAIPIHQATYKTRAMYDVVQP